MVKRREKPKNVTLKHGVRYLEALGLPMPANPDEARHSMNARAEARRASEAEFARAIKAAGRFDPRIYWDSRPSLAALTWPWTVSRRIVPTSYEYREPPNYVVSPSPTPPPGVISLMPDDEHYCVYGAPTNVYIHHVGEFELADGPWERLEIWAQVNVEGVIWAPSGMIPENSISAGAVVLQYRNNSGDANGAQGEPYATFRSDPAEELGNDLFPFGGVFASLYCDIEDIRPGDRFVVGQWVDILVLIGMTQLEAYGRGGVQLPHPLYCAHKARPVQRPGLPHRPGRVSF